MPVNFASHKLWSCNWTDQAFVYTAVLMDTLGRSLALRASRMFHYTMEDLVRSLRVQGLFADERVGRAMLAVDRADFCTLEAYVDAPAPIGCNATISAPHMHAYALQNSLPAATHDNARILDVGSGSGYLTACYAMLAPQATVVGIEHMPDLVRDAERNIQRHHADLLDSGRVRMVVGDGRNGHQLLAPYDVIHVGAASEEVPPALLEQLKPGGTMIIPVGDLLQSIRIITKDADGLISERDTLPVRYVPLTDREDQERMYL